VHDFTVSFGLKKLIKKCFDLVGKHIESKLITSAIFTRFLFKSDTSFKDLTINNALREQLEFTAWQSTPVSGTYNLESAVATGSTLNLSQNLATAAGNTYLPQTFDYNQDSANSYYYNSSGQLADMAAN